MPSGDLISLPNMHPAINLALMIKIGPVYYVT